MTKYFYARVSSDEQKKEGISIQAQISEGERLGIKEIYKDEGKSAGIGDEDYQIIHQGEDYGILFNKGKRPEFRILMDALTKNDELYFTKWDRISRNTVFQEVFVMDMKQRGVKLIPLYDNDDKLTRKILGVVGEDEIDKTKQRVEAVRKDMYNRGIHPYRVPYGYKKNKDKTIGVNEKEAIIVKKAYNYTLEGKDYKTISKELGISPDLYYRIIKNDIYIGNIHFKEETKKGIHEPIITQEIFQHIKEKSHHAQT